MASFGIAILAGIIAAALWSGVFYWWYKRRRKKMFQDFTGKYSIHPKFKDAKEYGEIDIKVENNMFLLSRKKEDDSVTGEIVMNEFLPGSGVGHYQNCKNGEVYWGLYQIQARDNQNILVHNIYANRKHQMIMKGYLWKKIKTI